MGQQMNILNHITNLQKKFKGVVGGNVDKDQGFIVWYSDILGSNTGRAEVNEFIFISTCRYHSRHNETVLCPRCQRVDRFRRNTLRRTPYCSPYKIVVQAASFHISYTVSLELISWWKIPPSKCLLCPVNIDSHFKPISTPSFIFTSRALLCYWSSKKTASP